MASVTLSQDFTIHLKSLYNLALEELGSDFALRGINCYSHYAAPALISAVAGVEAFLDEVVFGSPGFDSLITMCRPHGCGISDNSRSGKGCCLSPKSCSVTVLIQRLSLSWTSSYWLRLQTMSSTIR